MTMVGRVASWLHSHVNLLCSLTKFIQSCNFLVLKAFRTLLLKAVSVIFDRSVRVKFTISFKISVLKEVDVL